MEISKAKNIVSDLMHHHKLFLWRVEVTKNKSTVATSLTRHWHIDPSLSTGVISISRDYMEVFDEAEVRETALHEIAHALTNPSLKAHGPEWKYMAKKIGSNADVRLRQDAPRPKSRYTGTCQNGHQFGRHRWTSSLTTDSTYCPPCRRNHKDPTVSRLQWVDNTTGERINSVREVVRVQRPATPKVAKTEQPKAVSWKDKYDRGMTSFDEDW